MSATRKSDSDSKIRVLLLDTNDAMGGVVRVHIELLKALDKSRFDVSLACLDHGDNLAAFRQIPDIRCLEVGVGTKPSRWGSGVKAKVANVAGLVPFALSAIRLTWFCRKHGVQVLHTSDKKRAVMLTHLIHRLSGVPYVYHIHGDYVEFRGSRRYLDDAAAVIAVAQHKKEHFIDRLGSSMERIEVVRNGIDPESFKPDMSSTLRSELRLPDEAVIIGMAGRLAPEKGQETLFSAFSAVAERHPNVHVAVAGDDSIFSDNADYVSGLHKLISLLGLGERIHLLGKRDDMPNVYSGFDIVVNASIREAMPMAVLEAMACGKVVVATRVGGTPEIIQDKVNGYLFPYGDEDALAAVLDTLLSDRTLLRDMSRQAYERFMAQFTTAIQAQAVADVYTRMAATES